MRQHAFTLSLGGGPHVVPCHWRSAGLRSRRSCKHLSWPRASTKKQPARRQESAPGVYRAKDVWLGPRILSLSSGRMTKRVKIAPILATAARASHLWFRFSPSARPGVGQQPMAREGEYQIAAGYRGKRNFIGRCVTCGTEIDCVWGLNAYNIHARKRGCSSPNVRGSP